MSLNRLCLVINASYEAINVTSARRALTLVFKGAAVVEEVSGYTRGDLVKGAPLCLHPHVGVARQHCSRDVPGDSHDHLVGGARFTLLKRERKPPSWSMTIRLRR
jgi:hypothetical protein